jgi:hypothetical protein
MAALVSWPAPLDPSEIKDYRHSFQAELTAVGDTIATSTFILPADATAAGLEIASQAATSVGGVVFFQVNSSKQADAGWEAGVTFDIRHQITTTGGRTYERSIKLTVKQQ